MPENNVVQLVKLKRDQMVYYCVPQLLALRIASAPVWDGLSSNTPVDYSVPTCRLTVI